MCENGEVQASIAAKVGMGQKSFFHEAHNNLDENIGNGPETTISKMNACSSFSARNAHVAKKKFLPELTPECCIVNERGKEAPNGIGLPFLESATKTMNEKAQEVQVPISSSLDYRIGVRQESHCDAIDENLDKNGVGSGDKFRKMDVDFCENLKRNGGSFFGDRSSKMDVDVSVGVPYTTNRTNPVPKPELEKVHEGLCSSVLDLDVVVEGRISNTLCRESNIFGMVETGGKHVQSEENQSEDDMERCDNSLDKGHGVHFVKGNARKSTVVSEPSLMEWNSTAQTYEWVGGEIESEVSSKLRTMRTRVTLRKQEFKNITGSKIKKWSTLEVQTLIDAVKEYGRGNWRRILDNCKEIFKERTAVDLKDKWRNLTK